MRKDAVDPMQPTLYRIAQNTTELSDSFTLALTPENGPEGFSFKPGQFNMIYQFGVGEVPISLSGDPGETQKCIHTIRAVGAVTRSLRQMKKGETVGLRGPFGSAWPVQEAKGRDVIIVAGGIGLAPLRPVIYHLLSNRQDYKKVVLLYGARTPKDILFNKQLERWAAQPGLEVRVTVDQADRSWDGSVGVVTRLIEQADFAPANAIAMVCGPEIMMLYAVRSLVMLGLSEEQIYLSMERNMKCAIGFCGHCQWGSSFVCKDGPVYAYSDVAPMLNVR